MSSENRREIGNLIAWLVVAVLGALEGLYGRWQYMADWISYLNVSRAVSSLDWRGIFNPMWPPGYPILVALIRSIFPHTAEGEWYSITLLNWLIFLAAYACWQYLIREAIEFQAPSLKDLRHKPVIVWITCCAFLSFGLCFDKVSRVSPDLLVTTLFLFATAQILSLLDRPTVKGAIALGLVLGAGAWIKGVLVPYAGIFFLVLCAACIRRKISWRLPAVAVAIYLAVLVPYVAAISWSYGGFTLGASGQLNYAFYVNHLPHWTNWQGGPPQFGKPLHPSTKLLSDLPVFEFGTPFHTTYPPFNNMAYWYKGFVPFFSLRNQIVAFIYSLYFFTRIVKSSPFLVALSIVFLVVILKKDWRRSAIRVSPSLWPVFLPAILGLATYLCVHIEDRYVGVLMLILSLLPLSPLLDPQFAAKRKLVLFLLTLYTLGAAAELATPRDDYRRGDFHRDSQWQLAVALPSYGLRSGDPVAVVGGGILMNMRCSWAYVSHLRIVAEFGSLPWTLEPANQPSFARLPAQPADEDAGRVFWGLIPDRRDRVIQAFQRVGAKAIVSFTPPSTAEPGWQPVGRTGAWIYLFSPRATLNNGN